MKTHLKILHLEDDNMDAELVANALESGGADCEIVRVQDRDEFVNALEVDGFDLILADYKLPSFDGASALVIKREKRPDIPFIFVSGTMGEDVAVEAMKLGATDYVLKDRLLRLAPAVHRALREADERRARTRAEEEARELGDRLHALVEESPVGAFIIQDGRIVFANPGGYDMFGYEAGSTPGIFELVHPDDIERATESYTRMISGEVKRERLEVRCLKKDGGVFDAELFSFSSSFQGRPAIIGTIIDITERKRAENALHAAHEQRRLALESARLGAWEYNLDSDDVFCDERCRVMYGLTEDVRIDHDGLIRRIHLDDRAATDEAVKEAITGVSGGAYRREFRVPGPGGTDRWISSHGRVYFEGEGAGRRATRFVGVNQDITERKQLEQQRADMYAMITHDLKSPLTTILGYSDLMLEMKADRLDADIKMMVSAIRSGGYKLLRMVEDFLTVSKLESGNLALNATPADMAWTLAEAGHEVQAAVDSKGLTFEIIIQDGLAEVMLDHKLVQRAVLNLLDNAVNYTPGGGRITLEARRKTGQDSGSVVISVTDTGVGIAPGLQAKVFDKYFRAPHSAGVKGTGLGLSIVKAVAEAHRGRVELESEPGKGSTFKLILPVLSKI